MAQAKVGDTVRVHYTGKLDDGTEFDSSAGGDPLEFAIGSGQLIPGFETAVVGMNPGDSRKVTIPHDQAYGKHQEEMVITVPREELPDGLDPEIGDQLELSQDKEEFVVTVTQVTENDITLDANHPLAGKDLTFDIELDVIVA